MLTHDVATITHFAYERVVQGLPMPGVIEVDTDARIGQVIEDVLLVVDCSLEGEMDGQIQYLPL